jgi:Skp family chaperone for outer membrane proteins
MNKETEQLIHLRNVIGERNLEIDNLKKELARVKGIARARQEKIANLQQDVAVLEDKLEDTRSELKYAKKELEEEEELEDHGGLWGAHCRGELA